MRHSNRPRIGRIFIGIHASHSDSRMTNQPVLSRNLYRHVHPLTSVLICMPHSRPALCNPIPEPLTTDTLAPVLRRRILTGRIRFSTGHTQEPVSLSLHPLPSCLYSIANLNVGLRRPHDRVHCSYKDTAIKSLTHISKEGNPMWWLALGFGNGSAPFVGGHSMSTSGQH